MQFSGLPSNNTTYIVLEFIQKFVGWLGDSKARPKCNIVESTPSTSQLTWSRLYDNEGYNKAS